MDPIRSRTRALGARLLDGATLSFRTASAERRPRRAPPVGVVVGAMILGMVLPSAGAPSAVAGQTGGSLPRVTQLPSSARAMALGGAYVLSEPRADALFSHPALLLDASGLSLGIQGWGDDGSAAAVAGAVSWFDGRVGIGAGLLTLQHTGTGPGAESAPPGQDDLFRNGMTPVSERVAVLGAAGALFGVDVGVSAKLIEARIGGVRDDVVRFDAGAARAFGPVTVGLTLVDFGEAPIVDEGGPEPARAVLGVGGYGWELEFLDIGAAATLSVDGDDASFGGGVEVGYWPVRGRTFVARAGIQDVTDGSDASPFSFGLAFWGDSLTLEWAHQPFSDTPDGGTHRLAIGWR